MKETFNLDKPLIIYLDNREYYEKNCELMYHKLCLFMLAEPQRIYAIKKRVKEGKSVKAKMLTLVTEGKKHLFNIEDNHLQELKKGEISIELRKKFTEHHYSLPDNIKPIHIKDHEWNIGEITFFIKNGKVFKKIDERNVLNEITDVIGLRIVCYFKEDRKYIHDKLIGKLEKHGEIKILEKELHYPSNWTLSEDENYFLKQEGFKPCRKDSMYSALHYIVLLTNDDNKIPIEIQVRTMFEEVFGELEHDISYKYFPTRKSEAFKTIGSMMWTLDNEMQNIKEYIKDKEKEIKEKLMESHYSFSDDTAIKKIFKLMSLYKIEPDFVIEAIERVFKDLDTVFYDILSLDKDMILIFLCFENMNESLNEIRDISKCKLIEEFFERLDSLIKQGRTEECKKILEKLSDVSMSIPTVARVYLTKCRENIDIIKERKLLTEMNDFMLEFFREMFIVKDKGLLEHENIANLLVEIWDWLDDDSREKWMLNIEKYIKKSKSENSNIIIENIFNIFSTAIQSKPRKVINSDFPYVVQRLKDVKKKSGDKHQ